MTLHFCGRHSPDKKSDRLFVINASKYDRGSISYRLCDLLSCLRHRVDHSEIAK
ncbi:hypothetical protein IQ264_29335 [Phormidium sp. LEGE 05292]|uniref:hypothetical protein n=1 Tax=[Phormidium] sp. LEGE 05292 TaxID=767427 RepID=UPI0018824DF9|nr:hypothetical protein [Phormidium sp. LEGE 05292]MBE9229512.1 hypothetical protein [Phormidium sp. LEGE 05292]